MKSLLVATLLVLLPSAAFAGDPDCAGVDRWPTSMAFVHLKNAGITDSDRVDFTKTKTMRLASEKIGTDLFRQVHDVTFTERSGRTIEVIAVSDASHEECSMDDVTVFVVTQRLGTKPVPNKAAAGDGHQGGVR